LNAARPFTHILIILAEAFNRIGRGDGCRSKIGAPQRLKPELNGGINGTTEVVPFPISWSFGAHSPAGFFPMVRLVIETFWRNLVNG
jgi:hypothetical protein